MPASPLCHSPPLLELSAPAGPADWPCDPPSRCAFLRTPATPRPCGHRHCDLTHEMHVLVALSRTAFWTGSHSPSRRCSSPAWGPLTPGAEPAARRSRTSLSRGAWLQAEQGSSAVTRAEPQGTEDDPQVLASGLPFSGGGWRQVPRSKRQPRPGVGAWGGGVKA